MKNQELQKRIARMDGRPVVNCKHFGLGQKLVDHWCEGVEGDKYIEFKPYTTSLDAVLPVVRKQFETWLTWPIFQKGLQNAFGRFVDGQDILFATANQFCIALIHAETLTAKTQQE